MTIRTPVGARPTATTQASRTEGAGATQHAPGSTPTSFVDASGGDGFDLSPAQTKDEAMKNFNEWVDSRAWTKYSDGDTKVKSLSESALGRLGDWAKKEIEDFKRANPNATPEQLDAKMKETARRLPLKATLRNNIIRSFFDEMRKALNWSWGG